MIGYRGALILLFVVGLLWGAFVIPGLAGRDEQKKEPSISEQLKENERRLEDNDKRIGQPGPVGLVPDSLTFTCDDQGNLLKFIDPETATIAERDSRVCK